MVRFRNLILVSLASTAAAAASATPQATAKNRPHVIFITVDTLRADRLSTYGYERETSPVLDGLIESGLAFAEARTVEPLTSPALCSMVTSRYPHQHGATRNGLRMRPDLDSLPKLLAMEGYHTAAFPGNWTLRDKLSGLAEHFDDYDPVLTKKRWWGVLRSEALAADLNERALGWIDSHLSADAPEPFMLWVHYSEPHAPYLLHEQYTERLGIETKKKVSASDRYDTEIAYVDAMIGEFLDGLYERAPKKDLLIIVAADHGESLGEHDYWGHGRNLYEPTLRIPMAIAWEGKIRPRRIEAPALLIDLAPTVASLVGASAPATFEGYDWTATLNGAAEPMDRVTRYEAHKSAVLTAHDSDLARRAGLIDVGLLQRGQKEILRVKNGRHRRFDLSSDPGELTDLSAKRARPTEALEEWLSQIATTLLNLDREIPEPLDEESIERLRALGYAD
jgi:arylsulfatase A-like enzyme